MEISLPDKFIERIKEDLGDEADSFLGSYHDTPKRGLRINPLKTDCDTEKRIAEGLDRIPWESHGYYYAAAKTLMAPGRSPLHAAGAYYIQEPSAMAPVSFLDVQPGMCVLDLCAAPGGKSTQIASLLNGEGLLIANEIISDRARILSQNIERMGIRNALVLSHDPKCLALKFPASFDRILVDAPCSGEGMFRRDAAAIEEWSPENVSMCAERQEWILDAAASMLKPGGRLVYSTCTFSKAEDEEQAERFLKRHQDYRAVMAEACTGIRKGGVTGAYRIMPQDGYGEGHFIAVFERAGRQENENDINEYGYRGMKERPLNNKQKQSLSPYLEFIQNTLADGEFKARLTDTDRLFMFGKNICLMPACGLPALDGQKVIRAGLELGEIRKDRFIPSHSLAMAMNREDAARSINLEPDGAEIRQYLNGQTLSCTDRMIKKDPASGDAGWTLITVSGISLGWAKASGSVLKNHYPRGIRINTAC